MGIKYPFQNPELDLETRINDLVGRLTVEKNGIDPNSSGRY